MSKSIPFFKSLTELEGDEKETAAFAMLNAFGRMAQSKNWNPAQIFLNVQNAMDDSLIPKHIGESFLDGYLESHCCPTDMHCAPSETKVRADVSPKEPAGLEASNSNVPTAPQNRQEPMNAGGSGLDERKGPAGDLPVKKDSTSDRPGEKDSGGDRPEDPPQVICLLDETPVSREDCAESKQREMFVSEPPLASTSITPQRRTLPDSQNPENSKRVKLEDFGNQGDDCFQHLFLRCGLCSNPHHEDASEAMLDKTNLIWQCKGRYRHIVCWRGNRGNSRSVRRHAILEFLGFLALQKGFETINPSREKKGEMNKVLGKIAEEWEVLQHSWTRAVQSSKCPKCIYVHRGGLCNDYFKWLRYLAECYVVMVGSMGRDAVLELEGAWRAKNRGKPGDLGAEFQARDSSVVKSEGSQREPVAGSRGHGGSTFGFRNIYEKDSLKLLSEHAIQPPGIPFPKRKLGQVGDPVTCSVCKHTPTSDAECCFYIEFVACEPLIDSHAIHRVCSFDQKGGLKPCILTILTLWTLFQKTKDLKRLDMRTVPLPKLRITEERLYRMADDSIAMEMFSNQCPACTWTCSGFVNPFLDTCMDILRIRLKSASILQE